MAEINSTTYFDVGSLPEKSLAYTNLVYLSPSYQNLFTEATKRILIKKIIYNVEFHDQMPMGKIGLSTIQCQDLKVSINQQIPISICSSQNMFFSDGEISILVEYIIGFREKIEDSKIINYLRSHYVGHIISLKQHFLIEIDNQVLQIQITEIIPGINLGLLRISENTVFKIADRITEQKDQKISNSTMTFNVSKLPEKDLAYTNCVYMSPKERSFFKENIIKRISIGDKIYNVAFTDTIFLGDLALSAVQREDLGLLLGQTISVTSVNQDVCNLESIVNIEIVRPLLKLKGRPDDARIIQHLKSKYLEHPMAVGQQILMEIDNYVIQIKITKISEGVGIPEISQNTKFIIDEKQEQKDNQNYYFKINNYWFEIANDQKIINAVRKLIIHGLEKVVIKEFVDTPLRPDQKTKNYIDLCIYASVLFLELPMP